MTTREIEGAVIVIGALIVLGGPILWWIFYRMDEMHGVVFPPAEPLRSMSAADVAMMERELDVALPADYAAFVQGPRTDDVDSTSVIDDAASVIELTQQYRAGAYGLPPWPAHLVYIGDESDASPRVLDCATGECLQYDKGVIDDRPIERFASFTAFLAHHDD
jgi:hypothetical protein